QRAGAPVDGVLHRHPLHPKIFADHPGERRHRASELTAEQRCELCRLLVGGGCVNQQPYSPIPLEEKLRRVEGHGHYRPCDIDSFDLARVDAKSVYGEAAIVIGSRERVRGTGAQDLAVTGLEELTFHRPCHGNFLSFPSVSSRRHLTSDTWRPVLAAQIEERGLADPMLPCEIRDR